MFSWVIFVFVELLLALVVMACSTCCTFAASNIVGVGGVWLFMFWRKFFISCMKLCSHPRM